MKKKKKKEMALRVRMIARVKEDAIQKGLSHFWDYMKFFSKITIL